MIQQSSVLPYTIENGKIRVLVINNRSGKRSIIPKGIVEDGMTSAESAKNEALEEAGVEGIISPEPVGKYSYLKWGNTCTVDVFLLNVTIIHTEWEEDYFRERKWISWEEFSQTVDDRIPRSLLENIRFT